MSNNNEQKPCDKKKKGLNDTKLHPFSQNDRKTKKKGWENP